jgi:Membrane protein implicated in regulation of membrane protease activity
MNEVYWLGLFLVLLIIEFVTLGLTTIWFAGGTLVAFLAARLGAGFGIQLLFFLVVSFVLLFFTRPLAVKYLNGSRAKTNMDAIAGKTGLVKEEINNIHAQGKVMLQGVEWTARSKNDSITIKEDTLVEVVEVSGVKLIVKEKKEEM